MPSVLPEGAGYDNGVQRRSDAIKSYLDFI